MKNIAIIAVVLFTAVTIGCTAMNTKAPAPAPEAKWVDSTAVLPLIQMVEGEDGKRERKIQYAPLQYNPETMMFRFKVDEEKPAEAKDAPKTEKTE